VQSIAIKAIESTSAQRAYIQVHEKGGDAGKA
jgi:hypothetical protein